MKYIITEGQLVSVISEITQNNPNLLNEQLPIKLRNLINKGIKYLKPEVKPIIKKNTNVVAARTVPYLEPNPSWINSWFSTNKNAMIAKLFEKIHKLDRIPFNPKNVKIVNNDVLDSIERGQLVQRPIIEIKVTDTGDNFLIYSSSGTGAPELKQKGDWQLLAGFQPQFNNPKEIQWYIKDEATTQLTKGLNKWATELDKFIKTNGVNALGK